MRADKIKPYALYVIAFSLVCSLASELKMALSSWSWGFSTWSISSIFGIFFNLPSHILYAVLQVVAAVLTIRALSLRKLFYLSCVFTVVDILLTGLNRQIMEPPGRLFFYLFLARQIVPYVAPVVILALIGRKKSVIELSPGVGEGAMTCAESESAAQSEARGEIGALYKKCWYVFDILLIIIVYLYGTLNDPFGFLSYVCGLCNRLEIMAGLMFMWVLWMVPAALCGVVLLLRMIISWPKYIQNRRRLLLLRLLVIVGLGSYLVLPFTPLKPRGIDVYIKGFEKYIGAKADIAGIRNWLGTLGPEDCVVYNITNAHDGTKSSSPKDLQKQEWPKVVDKLKPRYVTLSLDDDKQPMVRLNWGSGFLGSWGLVVGNEAMPTLESDLSPHGEYRQEIRKGAYIWYGMD